MKKLLCVVALVAIVGTGTVFADYPSGFGIGAFWGGSIQEGGFDGRNAALSLKFPNLPIFWGVNFGFPEDGFAIGVLGDYYFIHNRIVGPLHWYLGLGVYANFHITSGTFLGADWTNVNAGVGARIPIGLSLQPLNFFELFLTVAPRLGVAIEGETTVRIGNNTHTIREGDVGFGWSIPIEIGLRFWL